MFNIDNFPHLFNSKISFRKESFELTWGGKNKNWWYWSFYYIENHTWIHNGKFYRSRFWGMRKSWYDGPRPSFGFWFFCVYWQTPWTSDKGFFT